MLQIYQQGCIDIVQLDERLTVEEIDEAKPEIEDVTRGRLPQVIIDLRRLRLIDSAGLELLCDCQANCVRHGGEVRLASTNALIADVLRVTGLDTEFAIHPDVISAAGAFAG